MANFEQLKATVANVIKTNGEENITGAIMQDVLLTIINSIAGGYMFGGVAQHSGNVGNPDYNVFYLAGSGAYTGYGGAITIPDGCYGVFLYDGTWSQEVIDIGVHLTGDVATDEQDGVTGGRIKQALDDLEDNINTAINELASAIRQTFESLLVSDVTAVANKLVKITEGIRITAGGQIVNISTFDILAATAEKAGLMSAADKQMLDGLFDKIRTLSISDTTPQGEEGVKIVESLSATLGGTAEVISTFTILAATASKAGLMSAADKTALDTLPSLINAGYLYAGIATPSTVPSSTSAKIYYIAIEGGTYTSFNLNVTQGINIIYKSGNAWSVAQVVGIDNEPTAGSDNLVKSGGVKTELALGAVYDVSAHHNGATFESLSALLSDTDLNALIPTAVRKGGMSIKFVQSSDNKYAQYFLNKNTWSTVQSDWQKINLEKELIELNQDNGYYLPFSELDTFQYSINNTGVFYRRGTAPENSHKVIPICGGQTINIKRGADNAYWGIVKSYSIPENGDSPDYATDESARYLSGTSVFEVVAPVDAKFLIIPYYYGGSDRHPSVLTIDGYDVIKGMFVQLREEIRKEIENVEIETSNIEDGAVSPDKTNFFVLSKNLFDYTTMLIQGKYINSKGNESDETTNWECSDFIPVSSAQSNIVSNKYPIETQGAYNCFYDENKHFISGSAFRGATSSIPSTAAYVRFSFPPNTTPLPNAIQIEYGSESTPFVPYGKTIDEKYIPEKGGNEVENEIIVPKYFYLLSDVNNDIFYEPILKKWNPYRYDVFANTTPVRRNYVKAIKRVVTLNNPTATGISLRLYDLDKEDFVQTKSVAFRKGTQGVGNSEIKVGIIGDSYVDGGCFTYALLANGYVPNIKMVGTRAVNTTDYANQRADGRAGWTLGDFFTPGIGADYFNPYYHPSGSHRFWGNTAFWANVCGGSPSGTHTRYAHYASLFDVTGWPVSPIEGDVIYDSTNSVWKEYQSGSWVTVLESDYTWEFSYQKYLSMWNIETADIFCIMLGVNDFWVNSFPSDENLAVWKTRMDVVIASYLAVKPNGKFVILTANTVTHPNVLHYRPLDVHNRMQILRKFVINNYDNRESENIYVVDTAQLIDCENGFTLTSVDPFDGYPNGYGYSNKEVYANDGQHPRVGFTTIGYSLAAFIQYMR